ncbi:MAG: cytochrome c [Gemmatimonadetes bacterium]|nr:cytochrome c [Gemmatimonadota bacterium]
MARSHSSAGALLLAVGLVLSSAGCTRIDNALASVPFLAFMRNAPSFDPYEATRPAPPGAIPYRMPGDVLLPPMPGTDSALAAFAAGPYGKNPLPAGDSAVLALGQVMFNRHCSPCHGDGGQGNGAAVGPTKFPFAPNLTTPPATDRADGYVYAIIRAGRGLMPSYGARITHRERWAIVQYVRQLQVLAPTQPIQLPPTNPTDRPVLPQDTAGKVRPDTLPQENR